MISSTDFSWVEVGTRIRDRRLRRGFTQQALAAAADITQNGIFRLEAGETNPQLTTLQQIAAALECSVRELVVGVTADDPILAQLLVRAKRVIESGDEAAIRVMDNGIETAEALLERSGRRRGLPPLRVKGQGRHSPANDLLWMKGPLAGRSTTHDTAKAVRKAGNAFRNSDTTRETRSK